MAKQVYNEEKSHLHNRLKEAELTHDQLVKMEGLLDGIESWADQEMKPGDHVRAALMAEMAEKRNKKGIVWLNGLWAWLLPRGRQVHRTPIFQMGLAVGCVVLVILAVNLMGGDPVSQNDSQMAVNDAPKNEKKEVSEKSKVDQSKSEGETDDHLKNEQAEELRETVVVEKEIRARNEVTETSLVEGYGKYKNLESSFEKGVNKSLNTGSGGRDDFAGFTAPAPPEGYSSDNETEVEDLKAETSKWLADDAVLDELDQDFVKSKNDEDGKDNFKEVAPGNAQTANNMYFSDGVTQTTTGTISYDINTKTEDVSLNRSANETYKDRKGATGNKMKTQSVSLAQSDSDDLIDLLYTAE